MLYYDFKFQNIIRTEICVICFQRQRYRIEKLYSRVSLHIKLREKSLKNASKNTAVINLEFLENDASWNLLGKRE